MCVRMYVLQIDFNGGLFQILAHEEKEDSFLTTLCCFCFQSAISVCCFAAKVSSASKLLILHMGVPCSSYFSGGLKTKRLLSNVRCSCLWFISLSPF